VDSGADSDTGVVGRRYFAERPWPSVGMWVVGFTLAATAGLVFYPAVGWNGVIVAGLVCCGLVVAVMAWWSAPVRVVDVGHRDSHGETTVLPWLQAGRARIPLTALGDARALRRSEWTESLRGGLDARSYRFVRGWIGTGVRVEVTDPRDPVPYWLISTRRPDELLAALATARSAVR